LLNLIQDTSNEATVTDKTTYKAPATGLDTEVLSPLVTVYDP